MRHGRACKATPQPMCAATAALCLAAVAIYQSGVADDATNQAGWSEIAAQASDLEQGQ